MSKFSNTFIGYLREDPLRGVRVRKSFGGGGGFRYVRTGWLPKLVASRVARKYWESL